jgi:hypothetical protein
LAVLVADADLAAWATAGGFGLAADSGFDEEGTASLDLTKDVFWTADGLEELTLDGEEETAVLLAGTWVSATLDAGTF